MQAKSPKMASHNEVRTWTSRNLRKGNHVPFSSTHLELPNTPRQSKNREQIWRGVTGLPCEVLNQGLLESCCQAPMVHSGMWNPTDSSSTNRIRRPSHSVKCHRLADT
eukprot:2241474-Amphidinium_carterae.1